MAIILGIEHDFISRTDDIEPLKKVSDFLANAGRFNGVWPH
jgi:hypothetical protein